MQLVCQSTRSIDEFIKSILNNRKHLHRNKNLSNTKDEKNNLVCEKGELKEQTGFLLLLFQSELLKFSKLKKSNTLKLKILKHIHRRKNL